jgi:ubiquinone/menaquinone biosynthesis C-methylase UbiE
MQPSPSDKPRRTGYDRIAGLYAFSESLERYWPFRVDWRARLLRHLTGTEVLEVGIGTGANLPYYPPGIHLVGIDTSRAMLAVASQRAQACNQPVALQVMDVQELTFPDNSFDTVVASLVFCAVTDPVQGLREVRRVCRPEGRVLLMEHVRPRGLLGVLADAATHISSPLFGEHFNRRTVDTVERAGLKLIEREEHWAGIIQLMVASPGK